MTTPEGTANTAVEELIDILNLEQLEHNLFRGRSPKTGWQRVFGGQVIGQALVAAQRTVPDDRQVHSLHGYFLRPGDPEIPIIYDVDRIRDGGSFTTRRVVAIQHGHAIFSMSVSFHISEEGLDFYMDMPSQADPETLMSEAELKAKFMQFASEEVKTYWKRDRPIEVRATSFEHYLTDKKLPPEQYVWVRATGPIPNDPALPLLLDEVYACSEVVEIDYNIPGCAPTGDVIYHTLRSLLAGKFRGFEREKIRFD